MAFKTYGIEWNKESRTTTYYTNPSKTTGVIVDYVTKDATNLDGTPYTGEFEYESSHPVMHSSNIDKDRVKGYYLNGKKSGHWSNESIYSDGRGTPSSFTITNYNSGKKVQPRGFDRSVDSEPQTLGEKIKSRVDKKIDELRKQNIEKLSVKTLYSALKVIGYSDKDAKAVSEVSEKLVFNRSSAVNKKELMDLYKNPKVNDYIKEIERYVGSEEWLAITTDYRHQADLSEKNAKSTIDCRTIARANIVIENKVNSMTTLRLLAERVRG